MALIVCPECKNEVSTSAAWCPRCGAPRALAVDGRASESSGKRLRMHTGIAIALALGSSVGLVAQAQTTARGANVAATVLGLLFVLAILYFIEIRIRSWWHHR